MTQNEHITASIEELKMIIRGLVAAVAGAACLALVACCGSTSQLTLADYPDSLKGGTIIIIGQHASDIEQETATNIATKLKELIGDEPVIKRDAYISEGDKTDHNLILTGIPKPNSMLSEVYGTTDATRVTSEYPGENRGILEILMNPWNADKVLLLVAGSNDRGLMAASELITHDDKIAGLEGRMMIASSEDGASTWAITMTVPSGYLEISVLPGEVYANAGEQVEIRCTIYSLINTQVDINSVEVALFDSSDSLIRKQPMTMDSHWSANTRYTIVGDEASYRLEVNFTTPLATPGDYLEYTADSFPVIVNQKGV